MPDRARAMFEGAVKRQWVANSGKFATLTLHIVEDGRQRYIEMRAFREQVEAVKGVEVGQVIKVKANVETETLTNKAKEKIKVDGYPVNKAVFTITSIEQTTEAVREFEPPAQARPAATNFGEDDIPF